MAQFSRYQFIPSAKLFTQYISRPFLSKIYGYDLVINLLDIILYLSGLCLSARACRTLVPRPADVLPNLQTSDRLGYETTWLDHLLLLTLSLPDAPKLLSLNGSCKIFSKR